MQKKMIVALCAVVILVGCEKKKKTVQGTDFSGNGYTLKFPSSWQVNDSGAMGTDMIALSPLEDSQDTFQENVNVVLENLPSSMTDKKYLELSLGTLRNMFGVPSDLKFTPSEIGNHSGYHLRYPLQMGQNTMDNDVYIVIQKGAAYVITCTHAKGKRDTFKPVVDKIIKTFSIEN